MREQANLFLPPCSGAPCGAWLARSPRELSMCRSVAFKSSLLGHIVCPDLCEQETPPGALCCTAACNEPAEKLWAPSARCVQC